MWSWIESAALEPAPDLKQPEVGKLIRKLRQLTGRTQEQFVPVLGVSVSTLNHWENGHMQPSLLALRQIYTVLAQVSQSPAPKLQDGSKALFEKYLRERRQA